MGIREKMFVNLSDENQDRISGWLTRTGLALRAPPFKAWSRAFECWGADALELREAFAQARDAGPSLVASLHTLAGEIRGLARIVEDAGETDLARKLYYRAALYYLAADGMTQDSRSSLRHYQLVMPCFDRFRMLSAPSIAKLDFPYPLGTLTAHFRLPLVGHAPFPAIVILPGNDTVKEYMVLLEALALARGIATLTIDPPGWGESGLTGNRCRSAQDLRHCVQLAVDFLQGHPQICPDAIGIFGVDLGGLLAFYCAGLAPCFAAAAGLGGIFYVKQVWPRMPALQKRRIYRYTGLETPKELTKWFDQLEIEATLSQVCCPTLIVHGEKDTLIGPENACALAGAVRGETEVEIIPDEDHLCTQTLFQGVADRIFDWFADCLKREIQQSRMRRAGWLALQEMSFKCPAAVS